MYLKYNVTELKIFIQEKGFFLFLLNFLYLDK